MPFLRYVTARLKEQQRAATYRIYVTDVLKALAQADVRYYDLAYREQIQETRSADEIIAHIKEGINGD